MEESNQRVKRARTAAATATSKAAAATKKPKTKEPKTSTAKTTTASAVAPVNEKKAPKAAAAAEKSKPAAAAEKPKPAAAAEKSKPTAATEKPKAAAAEKPKPAAAAEKPKPAAATEKPKPTAAAEKPKPAPKKKAGPLEIGTDAPPFTVKNQDGADVTLESFKGQKNVVVFFYPKDSTPGCTKEACKFRDLKDEYDALDCAVLGVSADHEVSHGKFISKFNLNFSLLADTDRSLIKSYGASKAGDKIQRSTVLVDKAGKVAAVWNPVSGAEQHPVEVLAKLKEIVKK